MVEDTGIAHIVALIMVDIGIAPIIGSITDIAEVFITDIDKLFQLI